MQRAITLTQTMVGKKVLVALSGLVMASFVLIHMTEHFILFAGAEAYNNWAATLKSMPPVVWTARSVLLLSLLVHGKITMELALRNRAARPTPYKKPIKDQLTTYSARTMTIGGPLLGLFIVFHIAHFTFPGISLGGVFSHTDVYNNVVQSFRVPWVSAIYLFSSVLVGLHLSHGIWSALQSLGANHPRFNPWRKRLAMAAGLAVASGFCFIPIAAMMALL